MKNDVKIRERRFIIRDIFLQLLFLCDQSTRKKIIFYTIFTLIYVVFFRIDEFIYTIKNLKNLEFKFWHITKFFVELHENKLKLLFFASKINSFRQKMIFHIVVLNDEICSISFIKELFFNHVVDENVFFFNREKNNFSRLFLLLKFFAICSIS